MIDYLWDEQFLPIVGYPQYAVSNRGRVVSLKGKEPKLMKVWRSGGKSRAVWLYRDRKRTFVRVKDLMEITFGNSVNPLGLRPQPSSGGPPGSLATDRVGRRPRNG